MKKIGMYIPVIIIWFVVTTYQIILFSRGLSWDFTSYALNGQYLLGSGSYFEIFRPPLPSILIHLSHFSWLYVILSSSLLALSSVLLSKKFGWNPTLYYALILTPCVIDCGTWFGSELLYISLLQFTIVLLGRYESGIVYGLSILSRYSAIILAPLLLFQKRKQAIIAFFVAGMIQIPWLLFNYFHYGNFFYSIADQYANNIFYRAELWQPTTWTPFIEALGFLLPVAILGIIFAILYKKDMWKIHLIMSFILVHTVYSFHIIPLKHPRYLTELVIPVAYFSYIAISTLWKKKHLVAIGCVIVLLSIYPLYTNFQKKDFDSKTYYENLPVQNCMIMSNAWVPLQDAGYHAIPITRESLLEYHINQGYIIVMYKHRKDYKFTQLNNITYKDETKIIAGTGCISPKKFTTSYTNYLQYSLLLDKGIVINTNPCYTLFHDIPIAEKTCNFVNFNGFKESKK